MQAWRARYGLTGSLSPTGSVCPNWLAKPDRPLEHLRGTVLGFRNLQNYIHHALLHTGGFKRHLQPLS